MSLTKRTTRRLSLMAGSSIVAAGLSAVISAGAALAPTTAFAQSALCISVPPPNNNGTDDVVYPPGTYNPGIACDYTGDSAEVSTTGPITVSTSGGVPGDPLINGVNLRATGTDDINWNSTAGTVTGGNQTNGPVIDALSESGDINIAVGNPDGGGNTAVVGSAATVTHGVKAISTSGAITIATHRGISASNSTSGFAAIEARTSGDISISATQPNGATGDIHGRLYGILAEATGSGDVTIQNIFIPIYGPAAAAIDATTNTGTLTIDHTQQNIGVVRTRTAGVANINLAGVRLMDMTSLAGGQTTFTHSGELEGSGDLDSVVLRGGGPGGIVVNSFGQVVGKVDFEAYTGNLVWNINAQWANRDNVDFGAGNATLTVASDAYLLLALRGFGNSLQNSGDGNSLENPTILQFGLGEDKLINNGTMMVGPKSTNTFARYLNQDILESEVRLIGLEVFENAGSIYFGGSALPGQGAPVGHPSGEPIPIETDYWHDDVLLMPGTHWVGVEGGSRLIMDAVLQADQAACDVGLRKTGTDINGNLSGEMPAADCLGLQGGSTEGVTEILLNIAGGGDRGGPIRIVLVDVSGGTSESGHFVLDPASRGYVGVDNGYIDQGFFIMPLVYDPDAQQHLLIGVAGQNAWQTSTWAAAAHDAWRTSTGAWLDRQADLRGDLPSGVGGGVWLRTSADFADRKVMQAQTAGASVFDFDNSYEQRTYAITGGLDLLVGGGAGSAWVAGLMAGYGNAEQTYGASPNVTQFDSWTGGVYASYLSGGLYIDAVVNGNKTAIQADMPGIGLLPVGTVLEPDLLTVGVQLEAGWRFAVTQDAFVEPLAGVSWVRSKWDDFVVPSADPLRPGVDIDFNDPVSLRANIGARLGLDQDYGGVRAQYSVLGRVWNEFEGEHELTLHNIVDDVFVSDAFTGTMTEVGLGASVYGQAVSGFLNVGGKWGDDYESVGGSIGVRVAW